jgi:hypothetical protein
MSDDESCWNCGYLRNYTGIDFVQDFTCGWFAVHRNEKSKKLHPKKNLDEGCKFWKDREPMEG